MTRTVLITGGAARVGKAIAKGLAQDGWSVIIHFNRSEKPANALVNEIIQDGGKAYCLGANLSVPSELNNLVTNACKLAGTHLSALINNASTFDDDSAHMFTKAEFNHHFAVNLYAPLRLCQDFARQLPTGQIGAIVNMLDQRLLSPDPSYFTYRISKDALFSATKTMAQAFAPQIRVNGIGPGPTLQNKAQTDAVFDAERSSTLLGEGSPPDTIVQAVRYLLEAKAVTGQMIAVDGGQHLNYVPGE